MQDTDTKNRTETDLKPERPKLHKVILVNDDYTPRGVVAVFTKDVAEAKATNATDMARKNGYPLLFTTEPEE